MLTARTRNQLCRMLPLLLLPLAWVFDIRPCFSEIPTLPWGAKVIYAQPEVPAPYDYGYRPTRWKPWSGRPVRPPYRAVVPLPTVLPESFDFEEVPVPPQDVDELPELGALGSEPDWSNDPNAPPLGVERVGLPVTPVSSSYYNRRQSRAKAPRRQAVGIERLPQTRQNKTLRQTGRSPIRRSPDVNRSSKSASALGQTQRTGPINSFQSTIKTVSEKAKVGLVQGFFVGGPDNQPENEEDSQPGGMGQVFRTMGQNLSRTLSPPRRN
ncbi:MAG: hypothetical protein N2C12_03920 [Planctomycetales bacterium]